MPPVLTGDAAQQREAEHADAARLRLVLLHALAAAVLSLPLLLPMAGLLLPGWLALLFATPVQFVLGARFYVAGWKALRARTGNMDLLVALGTSAAYFYSLILVVVRSRRAHTYFEAAAVVITLVLLGSWLEARAKRATGARHPRAAWRCGRKRPASSATAARSSSRIAAVAVGDVVVVRPGERFPDRRPRRSPASSQVDESLLTGESLPVDEAAGRPRHRRGDQR